MDTEQFKQFMVMQQKMLDVILKASTTPTCQSTASTTQNTSSVPNFDQFDPDKEQYKNYIQRFKNYIEMKEIHTNTSYCAKLLLNSMGAKCFNLITALTAPKPPAEVQYDELLQLLSTHFSPKKNLLVAQHRFLTKYQAGHQSIAEFVASLRADIIECEFTSPCKCKVSVADIFLRAQFIRGVRDNGTREQLLQSSTAKFEEIVGKALALEAARMDAKELAGKQTTSLKSYETSDINKVATHKNTRGQHKQQQKHPNRGKVNYQELGIAGLCLYCGKSNHITKDCRTVKSKLKCTSCNKKGHVSKVCITTIMKSGSGCKQTDGHTNQVHSVDNTNYSIFKIVNVYQNNVQSNSERYYADIYIEGKPVRFEVDSGSGFTFLPRNTFSRLRLNNEISQTNVIFRSYTKDTFVPDGRVRVNIRYNGVSAAEELYIVPDNCAPLLGRTWIRCLGINLTNLDEIKSNESTNVFNNTNDIGDIMDEFASVFEGKIGCIPDYKVSLKLRPDATPVYFKERQIPYALTDRVNKELDNLESAGIITKVTNSDWGSPLVVIPKADGGVRLCVDYKVGVNQRLVNAHYPIKKVEYIFNSLRNSKYFCRLDLFKAYLHIPVDERSSLIQTISTHRGTYRMNRLSFGIKTAPAEFNRVMDQILRDVPGTESYFDDIIIYGKSLDECQNNLIMCLRQLQKCDIHLNRSKCLFFETKLEFLGHTIEHNRVLKSPAKVDAILQMPDPQTIDDVRRFLGMVTYYARFIKNASTITTPLRKLLHKDSKFYWSADCKRAFRMLKEEISSVRVLMPYNPELSLQLACDASPTGIAGILSHIVDGEERPVAFASRSLTAAEQNYSQLDREALAIFYAVEHFHHYLFGRTFKLITDNQPLMRIFHQNSKLPQMTSARLQRYAAFLTGYNYEIVQKKSSENVNVDCLSRAPCSNTPDVINSIDHEVHLLSQISSKTLNFKVIQSETRKDDQLSKTLTDLRNNMLPDSEYTINDNILFRGQRIVVPKSLHQAVLQELHHTHIGTTKMKQLARRYVYWPSIDKDIEGYVRACPSCALNRNSPVKAPHHPWEEPEGNWQRVHIDFAGPHAGCFFLVVVDAKSKWVEVGVCSAAPTSMSAIEMLQRIFSRNGYPDVVVSDNASIFQSKEFSNYCLNSGIFQKFIAPGHPATNGLAERNIQTLKKKLTAMSNEKMSIQQKIMEILFKYRATPLMNGKTPSELYLGRQIRSNLDALRPTKVKRNSNQNIPSRQLSVGGRVQARYYTPNKQLWKWGTVVKILGRLHYLVKLDNGYTLKRHINQLLSTDIPNDNPFIATPTQPIHGQQIISPPDVSNDDNNPTAQNGVLISTPSTVPGNDRKIKPQVTSIPEQESATQAQECSGYQGEPEGISPNQDQDFSSAGTRRSTRQRMPPRYLEDYDLERC